MGSACLAFDIHHWLWKRYDWGEGILRSLFLLTLLALTVLLWRLSSRVRLSFDDKAVRRAVWTLAALCLVVIGINARDGYKALDHLRKTDRIMLDQGQINYRAVHYLRSGRNPYGTDAVLEMPVVFGNFRQYRANGCATWADDVPDTLKEFKAQAFEPYWASLSRDSARLVRPLSIDDQPDCDVVRASFKRMALKYGPVTFLTYAPFVLLTEKSGIYWGNFFAVVALCLMLAYSIRAFCSDSKALGLLALIALLAPPTIRWNTLWLTASDLQATALGFLAVILHAKQRRDGAAILIGLACAAKLLPGLLYLPLLLGMRPRQWLLFGAAFCLPLAPFVVWDGEGVLQNLFLFNLVRPSDSTALIHFLPAAMHWPLRAVVALAAAAVALWAHRSRWVLEATLFYLAVVHLMVWSVGSIFHNNYLLWIMPSYILFIARVLSRPRRVDVGNGLLPSRSLAAGAAQ
jgi:hypothetical protein